VIKNDWYNVKNKNIEIDFERYFLKFWVFESSFRSTSLPNRGDCLENVRSFYSVFLVSSQL
jgi:hypothetical protein